MAASLYFIITPFILQAEPAVVTGGEVADSERSINSLNQLLEFGGLALFFFLMGLFLAWLLFGKKKRIHSARDENSRLVNRFNEIIEDQNVLLSSLSNKFGVEQKRWNLQLANRDTKLQDLNNRLGQFNEDSPTVRANLTARDEKIRKLTIDLNENKREIQRLRQATSNDEALSGRINQLENLLKQRDQEIRKVRAEEQSQTEEWTRLLKLKDAELEDAQRQGPQEDTTGLHNRIKELEQYLRDRDGELERLRNERAQQEKDINELLSGRDDELNRLRAERRNFEGSEGKLHELERIIQNKNNEIDSLKNAQRGRVQELEDILGERESMVVALQSDLSAKEGLRDQQGRLRELEDQITRLKRELADRGDNRGELQQLQNALRNRDAEYDGLRNQFETSRRDRDARIQELNDMLRDRDEEINRLHGDISGNEGIQARVTELEWQIGEKTTELEGSGKRIEELEYLLWEKSEQLEGLTNEKQGSLQELEWKIGEKDTELVGVRQEKDSLTEKIRELEWLLGEKDGELGFLRHEKTELEGKVSSGEALTNRVEELERSLRERDGELERWWNENEALKTEVRSKDSELDSLRRDRSSSENLNSRIQELEWMIGERDAELEKLRLDRSSSETLQFQLRDLERLLGERDREASSLRLDIERLERESRFNRPDPTIENRVRELERLLSDKDRELRGLRTQISDNSNHIPSTNSNSGYGLASIERASNQDLHTRIRELERLLDEPNHSAPAPSPTRSLRPMADSSEFRLTLEDGTVVYVKGDEQIEYQGRVRSASEIFNSMGDGPGQY